MPKTYPVSFISEGRFFKAGDPIPDDCIKPFMLKYAVKNPEDLQPPKVRNLGFNLNTAYSLDSEGNRLPTVERQMHELQKQAQQEEEFQEELLSQAESPSVKAAVEQLQEEHEAAVALEKANLEYQAKHSQAVEEYIRQKEAERLAEAEGLEPTKATVYGEDGEFAVGNSDSKPEPKGGGAFVKSKPETGAGHSGQNKSKTAKPGKLFVKRSKEFVPASSVDLRMGEDLYRLRPRTFGKAQKWIRHGKHQIK